MSDTQVTPSEGAAAPEAPKVPAFSIDAKYIEDGKILGKYESTVELLEAMATQAPQAAPVVDAGAPTEAAPDASGISSLQVPEAQEAQGSTGLDQESLARYEQEAISKGELSEASLKELESRGYPREIATAHVQGLLAQRKLAAQEVASAVGGTEVVTSALRWASENKSASEIAQINGALSSADPTTQALIIKGLVRESGAISGAVSGVDAPVLTSQPYPSQAQWLADLKNPLYKSDPAFRNQVMARMKSTDLNGGFKN